MSDPIDFGLYRLIKGTAAMVEPLRKELEDLQSIDISKRNGRELRRLRDRILHIKVTLLVCDAKTRDRIAEALGGLPPGAVTFEDVLAAAPERPTVKFV
jgi:hypothetical protein